MSHALNTTTFGHAMLSNFLLDPSYLNLNHGSFGTAAKPVLEAQHNYVLQQEARPDIWFRETYKTLIASTRQRVSAEVGLPSADNLVLLENASAAVNAIFRSLSLQPGDIFVYFSTAYGMVKHTAAFLEIDKGITILEVPIKVPITSTASLLDPMREALESLSAEEQAKVRIATFSHISSVPAFIEPIKELTEIVKSINPSALVLVDAAHAIGQIPVDIPSLGPIDYYLSNAHKWLYAPKGSAFLWTNPSQIDSVRPQPSVISSENDVAGGTDYLTRFGYTGTKDFTAYLSIADSLDFRDSLEATNGKGSIIEYTNGLAKWVGDYLSSKWKTSRLSPPEFEAALFNVVLPTTDYERATDLQTYLLNEYGIYMLALLDEPTGIVYTRLSAQIYLERDDFVKVGDLVLDFLSK
ncbi:hypothetical protein TrVE_jg10619 [Triparma verrucosa]|uniref:Aminotransferase class V domain-containing protein n=1 Tax=Triparma verrucosa TaxID=1606542 RepID=A0A9W7CBP5_9STRA|nr:hypothetical protein TrVE_jg10619 [Triparma verrucosa]